MRLINYFLGRILFLKGIHKEKVVCYLKLMENYRIEKYKLFLKYGSSGT